MHPFQLNRLKKKDGSLRKKLILITQKLKEMKKNLNNFNKKEKEIGIMFILRMLSLILGHTELSISEKNTQKKRMLLKLENNMPKHIKLKTNMNKKNGNLEKLIKILGL